MTVRGRRGDGILTVLVVVLLMLAAIWIGFSWSWRIQHDTPLMFYIAYLMDQYGAVPYRDIFETSFPGTFLLYRAATALFGYSDTGAVVFNLAWFAATAAATASVLRPFGWRVALTGPSIFALIYFGHGQAMMLQRDYLAVLPVALALALTIRPTAWGGGSIRVVGIGVMIGLAAAIKPQFALAVLPVLAYMVALGASNGQAGWRILWRRGVALAAGGAVVLIALLAWLWAIDGLGAFIDMAVRYLPLHLQLNGDHQLLSGWQSVEYRARSFVELGGYAVLLIPATLGVWLGHRVCVYPAQRALLAMLVGMAVIHALLPLIAGQFWDYHWMPFAWSLSMLVALAVVPDPSAGRLAWHNLAIVLVLASALWSGAYPGWEVRVQWHGWPLTPPLAGRVDDLAEFLEDHLREGDRVQPLDWTAGAVHAMLRARAPLATRFLYDYHFYHHPGNPYIQRLREQFLADLDKACPRFVIEVHDRAHPKDQPGAPKMPALRAWLQTYYDVVRRGDEYLIWERAPESTRRCSGGA